MFVVRVKNIDGKQISVEVLRRSSPVDELSDTHHH